MEVGGTAALPEEGADSRVELPYGPHERQEGRAGGWPVA